MSQIIRGKRLHAWRRVCQRAFARRGGTRDYRTPRLWLLSLGLLGVALGSLAQSGSVRADPSPINRSIYWGALINGDTYGRDDAPWDLGTMAIFEEHAGKALSIVHWGQTWWSCAESCGYQSFQYQINQYGTVRHRGQIPLVDWASMDASQKPVTDQPAFSLASILAGDHDAYILQWAAEAMDWGHPFFLRFNWEMNGDWFPWSEATNGNSSGEYVLAWRHVHDLFTQVGASNATWVWCPNAEYPDSIPLEALYPGDDYVDWTCIDGYNWGTNPAANPDVWKSFTELFGPTYEHLLQISPTKPMMIGETASTEFGGSKAQWITDMLAVQLPDNFPAVQAVLWFNWFHGEMDWPIESSPAAQAAFAAGLSSTYYGTSSFANLDVSPIPPLNDVPLVCAAQACLFLPVFGG